MGYMTAGKRFGHSVTPLPPSTWQSGTGSPGLLCPRKTCLRAPVFCGRATPSIRPGGSVAPCPARMAAATTCFRLPLTSYASSSSYHETFQIRTHRIGNAANARIMPEFVYYDNALLPAVPQGFQSHIQPDLVAVLEAVRNRRIVKRGFAKSTVLRQVTKWLAFSVQKK